MEQINPKTQYIGSGMLYPIQITKNKEGKTGWYPVSGDPDLIVENLQSIFSYQLGQRFRQEEFGTQIWNYLEEPNTTIQAFMIDKGIREALSNWEDRLVYKGSDIKLNGNSVDIIIHYSIPELNIQDDTLSVTYNK